MKKLTKKERKLLSKEKKKRQKESEILRENKFNFTTILWWVIGIVILIFFGSVIRRNSRRAALEPVHWHIPISYEFCGQEFIPQEKENHLLLHGHGDGLAHIEGKIISDKDITLGKFMDNIGLEFTKSSVHNYKNGDICPNKKTPGKVKVLIDGKYNNEFRDHVFSDGEKIKIIFN